MITVTIKDCQNFQAVYTQLREQKLPIRASYKLVRLAQLIEPELETYYNQINERIKDFAQLDDEGKFIQDENGNILIKPESQKEFQALRETEVEFPISIDIDELDGIDIAPGIMAYLMPFLNE